MSKRTVLIVEDEPDILMSLELALRLEGYRVLGAPSAEEGLDLLDGERPEVVLLDIALPGMDGWAFLAHLRARPGGEQVAVIVTSAHADVAYAHRASQLGCRAFLVKPFKVADLVQELRAIWGAGATGD